MKVKLTLNEQQARVLLEGLDLFSRILFGQLETVREVIHTHRIGKSVPPIDYAKSEAILAEAKRVLFPELTPEGFYGVFSPDLDEDSKIAWDIKQVVRNAVAWEKHPSGGMTVDFDPPMRTSTTEMLPQVEIVKEDKTTPEIRQVVPEPTEEMRSIVTPKGPSSSILLSIKLIDALKNLYLSAAPGQERVAVIQLLRASRPNTTLAESIAVVDTIDNEVVRGTVIQTSQGPRFVQEVVIQQVLPLVSGSTPTARRLAAAKKILVQNGNLDKNLAGEVLAQILAFVPTAP
jgi:hypothetical protein